ncbi:MAG: SDR family oxidoreductase [Ignavibacteria bacterium]|nr:SDR family oxidoreductase [Ignavibacteria bacterium]MBK6419027.1 SDR family oxidoreductase [Ignavibacteria bacterium]MBK6760289.1 SDR family oxidoreductase [Ignavibacteria bacterium]MBK7185249.1 SDR family oxidoreductase [Ignavibacteria bacterium]MBK7411931.1 SDR family oxidoreductase [Ignavibacteria bacterium]
MSKDLMRLDGRVAVVTGAAGLLGRRHCEALADAGATVFACDLSAKAAQEVAQNLGTQHVGMALDVTNDETIMELRSRLLDEHGGVDVLVNNAAMNDMVESPLSSVESSRFENYPVKLFRRVMDVNVTGVFLMSQIIGSIMAESGKGSIINIASTYGVVAPDQSIYRSTSGEQTFYKSAAYPTSKGAVIMLTKFLATYWGHRGVRANCLSPGGVENGQSEQFIEQYSRRTPLGRMATSTDYQAALVFLASDASRYMTGQNLIVDGGWTAW